MASNLQIIVKGLCSESKNDLAKDLRRFFIKRGYGDVAIIGSSSDDIYDGLLSDESVEIIVGSKLDTAISSISKWIDSLNATKYKSEINSVH